MSDAHKSHECGPCSPCHQSSSRYFYPKNWDETKRTHFAAYVMKPKSKSTDCICRACNHDLDSNIGNFNHVARWKKLVELKVGDDAQCSVDGCTSHGEVSTKMFFDEIPTGLHIRVSAPTTTICSYHYHCIYAISMQNVWSECKNWRKQTAVPKSPIGGEVLKIYRMIHWGCN